jgi:hypothetical protein
VAHSELLSTLAEVSIVFAGLTGVVGMLGFRSDNPVLHGQLYQIGAMIGFSLIAALFSIVPLLLSAIGLADVAVWRTSSLGLLAALLGWTAVGMTRLRDLRKSGYRGPRVLPKLMNALTVIVFLVLLASAAGFLGHHAGGVYLICVFVPLVYAAFFFLRAFLSTNYPGPPTTPPAAS